MESHATNLHTLHIKWLTIMKLGVLLTQASYACKVYVCNGKITVTTRLRIISRKSHDIWQFILLTLCWNMKNSLQMPEEKARHKRHSCAHVQVREYGRFQHNTRFEDRTMSTQVQSHGKWLTVIKQSTGKSPNLIGVLGRLKNLNLKNS